MLPKHGQQTVALKIVPKNKIYNREAYHAILNAQGRMNHPNYLLLFDWFESSHKYCMFDFCKAGKTAIDRLFDCRSGFSASVRLSYTPHSLGIAVSHFSHTERAATCLIGLLTNHTQNLKLEGCSGRCWMLLNTLVRLPSLTGGANPSSSRLADSVGMIHRDIKPENWLFHTKDAEVRISSGCAGIGWLAHSQLTTRSGRATSGRLWRRACAL